MKSLVLFSFLLFLTIASRQQTRYRSNANEAIKATQDIEEALFNYEPKFMKLVGICDIDPRDGHLLVVVKAPFLQADRKTQNKLFSTVYELWNTSKYVKDKKYGSSIEYMIHDRSGKPRPLRTLK